MFVRPLLALLLLCAPAAHAQEQPLPAPRPPMPGAPSPDRQPPHALQRPDAGQPLPAPKPKVLPLKAETPPLPPLPKDPAKRLDALFERLREPGTPANARRIEQEIERLFESSGSATTDVMMTRARQAAATRNLDLALDLLDYVTALRPRFAEAYHRRAQVHLLRKDEEAALRDLKMTLALEPRHYPALAALAMLMQAGGNAKGAFKALTRLREINPQVPEIGEALDKLRLDAEGQKV